VKSTNIAARPTYTTAKGELVRRILHWQLKSLDAGVVGDGWMLWQV